MRNDKNFIILFEMMEYLKILYYGKKNFVFMLLLRLFMA